MPPWRPPPAQAGLTHPQPPPCPARPRHRPLRRAKAGGREGPGRAGPGRRRGAVRMRVPRPRGPAGAPPLPLPALRAPRRDTRLGRATQGAAAAAIFSPPSRGRCRARAGHGRRRRARDGSRRHVGGAREGQGLRETRSGAGELKYAMFSAQIAYRLLCATKQGASFKYLLHLPGVAQTLSALHPS